jgi:hypothetical protein
VVDAAAAGVLDDDPPAAGALDDDDDADPHPPITAAIMATATGAAALRVRLDLNMGATPPLDNMPACRSALNLRRLGEANRFDQLAASPRR